MLDNIVYFLNIIWTYCTCMYYVSEINEYYYIIIQTYQNEVDPHSDVLEKNPACLAYGISPSTLTAKLLTREKASMRNSQTLR